jgi:DNA topoisomerase-1
LPPLRSQLHRNWGSPFAPPPLRQGLCLYRCRRWQHPRQSSKARIKQLAIPPAWTEVCIAEDERAHIQAVGRDAEGRLQYRYHPDWDKARSETKAQRLRRLGTALPRLRNAVRKSLSGPELTRTKVIAAVVRLIDRALLRPGYEEYAEARGSRGAATLLKSDVSVQGDKVLIEFVGKGGKPVKRELKDKLLAPVVKKLSSLKGRRLFSAADEKRSAETCHRP